MRVLFSPGRESFRLVAAIVAGVACAVGLATVMSARTVAQAVRQPDDPPPMERTEEAMGSSFTIVFPGVLRGVLDDRDRVALDAAADAAFEEVHRLDRLLSNYKPASEWSVVNRDAAARPVPVSDELFALLAACLEYSRRSEGAFDITVGPLMKVWGFYKDEGHLPRREEVASALTRVGYGHVILDPRARTVRFARPGLELDPGGIGKGYAVDRMVAILRSRGVRAALVSAAGSSIYGLGAPPREPRGWPITIRSPRREDVAAAEVFLKDLSLSTSGSTEKFFFADGRRYAHIMDPRTGYPARGALSVSVLAPRTIDSEAWTKPFFINGRAWTAARKAAPMRVFFCAEGPPESCAWVE